LGGFRKKLIDWARLYFNNGIDCKICRRAQSDNLANHKGFDCQGLMFIKPGNICPNGIPRLDEINEQIWSFWESINLGLIKHTYSVYKSGSESGHYNKVQFDYSAIDIGFKIYGISQKFQPFIFERLNIILMIYKEANTPK